MKCRHCGTVLVSNFLDLGFSPPSNSYLNENSMNAYEKYFPLRVLVCESCWLVQTEDFNAPEDLFDSEYAYFSSFSNSWLKHSAEYVGKITERLCLNESSYVVEVAANDGYLLQFFKENGIPCLGIEPTTSTANVAREKGLEIVEEFFSQSLAEKIKKQKGPASLVIANNVLAHVPQINDFVSGFEVLLDEDGVATFEFPHLVNLIKDNQFDTIYHEHFSYLSLTAVDNIFRANGLEVFDVEELPTHGGSLRVYAQRSGFGRFKIEHSVGRLQRYEGSLGLTSSDYYKNFQSKIDKLKNNFVDFLIKMSNLEKIVVGYGAAAKGNTLLNYAGIKPDLIKFIIDKNDKKIGRYMPGSHIPIVHEDMLKKTQPDYVVIFPWNLTAEIVEQISYIREWGGKFVVATPELKIFD